MRRALHLPDFKAQSPIDHFIYPARAPAVALLPLTQHEGPPAHSPRQPRGAVRSSARPPCRPHGAGRPSGQPPLDQPAALGQTALVRVGSKVRLGEKIADGVLALHAPVSGEVTAIDLFSHPRFGISDAIRIKNDGMDTLDSAISPRKNAELLNGEEFLHVLKEAGIPDLDEFAPPLYDKLGLAHEAGVTTLVVDASECEPFLASQSALMMNKSNEILRGLVLVAKFLRAARVVIAVSENKMEPREALASKMYGMNLSDFVIRPVPACYPVGMPAALRSVIFGKPLEKCRAPFACDAVILNMATLLAVSEAAYQGKPFYERVITLAGQAVAKPKNVLVRMGTSAEQLLTGEGGGLLRSPRRVIFGGPMRGEAQTTLASVVLKQTSAVLALVDETPVPESPAPCIRCSACSDSCPAGILPDVITLAAEQDEFETARGFGVLRCIECGNCTYVCPSRRPMASLLRYAKFGANRL